jgi:exodeoxyribonuclease VIII
MKEGLYKNVPVPDYEAWPAARSSILKLFESSAAHARHEMIHPREPTDALQMGQATHHAVLEPATFESLWIARPKIDRRTKVGKAEWQKFIDDNPGKEVLSISDFESCLRMRDAAYDHPTAKLLLTNPGFTECSLLWQDTMTTTWCKARLDRLTKLAGYSVVPDLKTTAFEATESRWQREVANRGYHVQAAHYLNGCDVIAPGIQRRFMWIVVEKSPPYGVAVYEPDQQMLEEGQRKIARYLELYHLAEQQNRWPSYDPGVVSVSLPRWAVTFEELEGDAAQEW